VRNHQNNDAPDRPDGLSPLLATLNAILHGDMQRIPKYLNGLLKAYAVMLAPV
jgi:hypothetical protein